MATITTSQFLDNGTARTAGEAWTINSGAELTIRTDTRWHSNSPASMTGSIASVTINAWKIILEWRNIRELPYNTGAWNVPAIGTTITQWWVSGYLLAVYASKTVAPTAVGVAMPASWFLKLREVSGGTFAAWALTWIGASATWPDVTWWMEIVADESANMTIPRLGEFRARWSWYELWTTNGSVAQVLQVPTNGGWANTHVTWVEVETASGSGVYEKYPSLNGALTNGWARQHIGRPTTWGDARQKFVKWIGSGQIQFWEAIALSATYASLAAQAWTYASISHAMTYTWASDIVTCYIATTHGLRTWQQTGLDFTSGWATADGIYTVTVLDAYRFTVPLTWSGASWNVTSRPWVLVTFASHGLNVGESTYCDFTTGTWVDGTYEIYGVPSTSTYQIKYPHTTALTSWNVSCTHTLIVTFTAHGLAVGNRVSLDFTTWTAVDGDFTLKVTAANTFNVNYPHSPTTSGNVTINMTIWFVPVTGCKVRIPNIFLRNTTSAARANNVVPNATLATRPEFVTTSAWAIDIEWVTTDWYCNFTQAYSVRIHDSFIHDTLIISECATALDLDNICIWMYWALDIQTVYLASNFAGGTISNISAQRWNAPWTSDHAFFMQYCIGQTLSNIRAGIVQFGRSTWYPFHIADSKSLTINNCIGINSMMNITSSSNITINDYDHVDKYLWYTSTTANYAINVNTSSSNITIDGITVWLGGTIPSVHPYSGMVAISASTGIKVRNIWTASSPIVTAWWAPNLTATGAIYVSLGNNFDIKLQRLYVTSLRAGFITSLNSDKQMVYESLSCNPFAESINAINLFYANDLNGSYKGIRGVMSLTWLISVYGNHFNDAFHWPSYWLYGLWFNEPTTETASQFTMVSGTARYNSSWGINMGTIGNQAIWEDVVFRKWHTWFDNITPVLISGTIGHYTIEYQIDTWSGYGGTWKTLNTTNLTAETLDPAVGFKMKIRITTTTTNTSFMVWLGIFTITSTIAQTNLYPLDVVTLTLTWLISGSDVVIYEAWTTTILAQQEDNSGTSYEYTYETPTDVDIGVFLPWYIPFYIRNYTLTSSDASLPIAQVADRAYLT